MLIHLPVSQLLLGWARLGLVPSCQLDLILWTRIELVLVLLEVTAEQQEGVAQKSVEVRTCVLKCIMSPHVYEHWPNPLLMSGEVYSTCGGGGRGMNIS